MTTRTTGELRESIVVIGKAINVIQLQSKQTGHDTDSLLRTITGGQKDAKTIKLLAQIATMFLPASLIAVSTPPSCIVLSSQLMYAKSLFGSTIFSDSDSNPSYIALYFATTLPALLITLLLLILLEKDVFRWSWPWTWP